MAKICRWWPYQQSSDMIMMMIRMMDGAVLLCSISKFIIFQGTIWVFWNITIFYKLEIYILCNADWTKTICEIHTLPENGDFCKNEDLSQKWRLPDQRFFSKMETFFKMGTFFQNLDFFKNGDFFKKWRLFSKMDLFLQNNDDFFPKLRLLPKWRLF